MNKSDVIKRPSHYVGSYGLEAVDVLLNFSTPDMMEGFYWGNVLKYVIRYRKKNKEEDLKKARQNLDWLIEHLELHEEGMDEYSDDFEDLEGKGQVRFSGHSGHPY